MISFARPGTFRNNIIYASKPSAQVQAGSGPGWSGIPGQQQNSNAGVHPYQHSFESNGQTIECSILVCMKVSVQEFGWRVKWGHMRCPVSKVQRGPKGTTTSPWWSIGPVGAVQWIQCAIQSIPVWPIHKVKQGMRLDESAWAMQNSWWTY